MSNLIDYIKWRGDLSFEQDPFNDVDALVLTQISYLRFDGILSSLIKETHSLSALWDDFKVAPDFEQRSSLGVLINKLTVNLFEEAAKSKRFSSVRVSAYVSKIDISIEEQFSAMTFFFSKFNRNPFVVFRGTDDTIVGWKEDFNMALSSHIPSQRDALEYLEFIAKYTHGKICVSGHSKGGNLAVYSSSFINAKYKKRIRAIYNFDGPGFSSKVTQSAGYKETVPLICSWYPEFSIVGMLFEHYGKYKVVECEDFGIMQHDPFAWHIENRDFIQKPDFDGKSVYFNKTFNTWMNNMTEEKRGVFIEALFNVLSATGAKTNSELESNLFDNSKKIIKALTKVDKETREQVSEVVKLLFESAKKNIPELKLL